ncbi:MAG: hypothetical protein WCO82_01930 [Sphingomonadales bacterium]|jgi:hypothetical protein
MQRLGLVLIVAGFMLALFLFVALTVESIGAWVNAHLPGNPLLRAAMTLAGPFLSSFGLWLVQRRSQQR